MSNSNAQSNNSAGNSIFNQLKSTTDSAGAALVGTFKATTNMFNQPNSSTDSSNPIEEGTEPDSNNYRQSHRQRSQLEVANASEDKPKLTLLEQMKLKAGISSEKSQQKLPDAEEEESAPNGDSLLIQIKTKSEAAGAVIMEQIQNGVKATSNLTSRVFSSGNDETNEEEQGVNVADQRTKSRDADEDGNSERMSDVRLSDSEENATQRRTSIFDTLKSKVGLGAGANGGANANSSTEKDDAQKESIFEQFKSKVGLKSGQDDEQVTESADEENKGQSSIFDQLKANAAKVNIFNQHNNAGNNTSSTTASTSPNKANAPSTKVASDPSAPRRFKERPPKEASTRTSSSNSSTANSPLAEVSGFFNSLTGSGEESKSKSKNNEATTGSFFDSFSTKPSSTTNNSQPSFFDQLTGNGAKKEESSSWL